MILANFCLILCLLDDALNLTVMGHIIKYNKFERCQVRNNRAPLFLKVRLCTAFKGLFGTLSYKSVTQDTVKRKKLYYFLKCME